MIEVLKAIIFDYTLRTVILGTALVGSVAGILGVFAFLRQQSLLGDAISHAALPGIAFTFLCTHSKNPAVLILGGAGAGLIGTFLVFIIHRYTTLKRDAALGIILSVFFGFGLVLMSIIQKYDVAQQAILNKFLFGDASTVMHTELYLLGGVYCVVMSCLCFLWKEFTIVSFDSCYAHSVGYPSVFIEHIMTLLLVITIVAGLQVVGVILMSTMLIAPAAAARQWTFCLKTLVVLAGCIGASASVIGSLISCCVYGMPTGPTIVIVVSIIVLISLIFSPYRLHDTKCKNNKYKT